MAIYIAHFIAPALEHRDTRAGESSFDRIKKEIEADTESQAQEKAIKMADDVNEGWELTDIEPTYPF
jgi:hypothetical protein